MDYSHVLIIKNEDNEFERFYSNNIRDKGCNVCEVYDRSIPLILQKIYRRLYIYFPRLSLHYGNWKKIVNRYDTIIIFDNGVDDKIIKYIRKKNPKSRIIYWLWNCFDVPLNEIEKDALVATFDENLAIKFGWLYRNQFYFTNKKVSSESHSEKKYDMCFIGYDKGRGEQLRRIAELLLNNNKNFFFYDYDPNFENREENGIVYSNEYLSYGKIVDFVNTSKCVLELVKEKQVGLTVRSLEALFYQKKLVTNNEYIVNYDFYDKSNIFVIGRDNIDDLINFLNQPYNQVADEVLEKYTFEYWIESLLKVC